MWFTWLTYSDIIELPDNLTVHGDLFLQHIRIKYLPENLTVWGSIYLSASMVDRIPTSLRIKFSFYYNNTPLAVKYKPEELNLLYPHIKFAHKAPIVTDFVTPRGTSSL